MANGWMFLNFENETDDQIEALLKLLEREYPEVTSGDIGLIYSASVMITVPPHKIDSIIRFVRNIFPTCTITWV